MLESVAWANIHRYDEAMNALGKAESTGHALMKAKAEMIADARKTANYHLCICELNLLGDPTLDMRAAVPRSPKLQLPASIAAEDNEPIHIKTDAPGCTICAWKRDEVYVVARADKQGNASIKFAAKSPGKLTLTVSGPNLNTVTKTISVVANQSSVAQ